MAGNLLLKRLGSALEWLLETRFLSMDEGCGLRTSS